jgi:hypothetical protein
VGNIKDRKNRKPVAKIATGREWYRTKNYLRFMKTKRSSAVCTENPIRVWLSEESVKLAR